MATVKTNDGSHGIGNMVTLYDPDRHDQPPICSVCIANYNGESLLRICLDSVLAQDLNGTIELIVHDDASTDNSVPFIESNYPGVRLLASEINVGFCISNNRMAEAARGDFLLLLNNDAALRTGALESLHRRASVDHFGGILTLPQYDMDTGALLDMGSIFDPFLNPVPNLNPARQHIGMVMGACLWCPRRLWTELGGFPVWFESLAEDMYLCLAAQNSGFEVRVEPTSGYDHAVGRSLGGGKVLGTHLSTTYRRRALSERNKTYVMIIFFPAALLIVVLPIHLTLLVLEGLLLSLFKRDFDPWRRIYWPALRGIWQKRSVLCDARAQAQRRRTSTLSNLLKVFTVLPYKLKMLLRHGLPDIK